MRNPYANVDFANAIRVPSFTHCHVTTQNLLDKTIEQGYKFLPVSNYHPSKPFDPTGFTYPSDVIFGPNAEHHQFSFARTRNGVVHMCAVGSLLETGSVDDNPLGYNWGLYTNFLDEAFANLKYPDAGGVTVNHPTWTRMYIPFPDYEITDILDYDDRVLGIEILNAGGVRHGEGKQYTIESWDNILATGRKCWGFCTPDWYISTVYGDHPGRCILLVDEFTEYKCLKAFRNGEFYGQEGKTNLGFSNISVEDRTVTVNAPLATSITAVIDKSPFTVNSNSLTLTIPESVVYVRFEATSANDKIYSNAITFREGRKNLRTYKDDGLLLT